MSGQAMSRLIDREVPEYEEANVTLRGELPEWLRGRLVRTAAAAFREGVFSAEHLFDALCSVYSLELGPAGQVRYRQRLLDSEMRRRLRDGHNDTPHFFTRMRRGPLTRLFSPVPRSNDNTNVNVLPFERSLVAMTETNVQHEIDPVSLRTRGHVEYDDEHGHKLFMLAHPQLDRQRGVAVNVASVLAKDAALVLYEHALAGPEARKRRTIAKLPMKQLPYLHSFGLTPQHAVLFAGPMLLDVWRLLWSERGYIQHFRYQPERGSKIYCVERATGQVRTFRAPAMFVFHVMNTFERDAALVQDVLAYHDTSVIDSLSVAALRGRWPAFGGCAVRLTMRPGREDAEVEPLLEQRFDFPTLHEAHSNGRPYRHAYGVYGSYEQDGYRSGIVQLDVESGSSKRFTETDYVFGEPVFVPRAGGTGERDGVLLSMASHASQAKSALVVLDAETLDVRAWGSLDIDVPLSFHGSFLTARA
jgi:beta,beta-carotene 9',10'-dioxygenase